MLLTATTIHQIIQQLYLEPDLIQCSIMYSGEMAGDIMNEIAIYLMNKNTRKIIEIYKRGELKYYVIAMIRNMSLSKTSQFQRKYNRDQIYLAKDNVEYNYKVINTDTDKEKEEIILTNKEHYFKQAKQLIEATFSDHKKKFIYISIFNLYFSDNLSIRKIARKAKLSPNSVFNYLKEIKQIIRNSDLKKPQNYVD